MREHSLQGEEWKIRYRAALSLCRHTHQLTECLPGTQQHQDGFELCVLFQLEEKKHFLGCGRRDQMTEHGGSGCLPSPPHYQVLPVSSQIDFVTWRQGRGAGVGPELSNRELCLLP